MKVNSLLRSYPFSLLTIAFIWYLSFFTPPSTKLDHVFGIDKIVHFGMYFFLTTVMLLERVKGKKSRVKGSETLTMGYLFLTLICPILLSGLIEILQENCTGGRRSGDVWDFVANSLGAVTAWLIWRLRVEGLRIEG